MCTNFMPEDMQNDDYLQVEPENTFVINRAEPQDIISDETEHISAGKAVQGTGELQEQETENPERPSGRRNKVKEAAEVSAETENVAAAVEKGQEKEYRVYHTPPLSLFKTRKEEWRRFRQPSPGDCTETGTDAEKLWCRSSCDQCKLRPVCYQI